MKHAIAALHAAAETAANNEPIHRAEGNDEQADLCLEVAEDCQQAIESLTIMLQYDAILGDPPPEDGD